MNTQLCAARLAPRNPVLVGSAASPAQPGPKPGAARGGRLNRFAALAVVACLTLGAASAHAAFTFFQTFDGLDLTVPDGSSLGASDTRQVSVGYGSILGVQVTLELSGGYIGDLYALLIHDGVSAVLLNRPGRRTDDSLGYADSGLYVTFSDAAAQGDVHNYRLTLQGSHNTPLGGPLTGTWQPDGRTSSPERVLDTDPRSGFLSSFISHTPDGAWTLFLADLSPVGEARLESWGLELEYVPEPGACAGLAALGLLGWGTCRRTARRSGDH